MESAINGRFQPASQNPRGMTNLVAAAFCYAVVGLLAHGNDVHADELGDHIAFSKIKGFLCRSTFPSKFDPQDSERCGDGDMTLFNWLLCLSGDQIGCDAVRNSQDVTRSQNNSGRWWRSPRRLGWEYPKHDVSFSPDQALGVLSYALATKDGASFGHWIDWIKSHKAKLSAAQIREVAKNEIAKLSWPQWQIDAVAAAVANALPERLSYCSDDFDARCTLRPGDCAIIGRIGSAIGSVADVCGQYLLFDRLEAIFNAVGLSVPGALSAAGSFFNDDDYPLRLAAVQVFLLQRAGEGNDPTVLAAQNKVAQREPLNPFFKYLAKSIIGPLGSHDLLLKECPAVGTPFDGQRPMGLGETRYSEGMASEYVLGLYFCREADPVGALYFYEMLQMS